MTSTLSALEGLVHGAVRRGDAEVCDLSHDSRTVRPGWMYCAVPGRRRDGEDFVADAVRAGASALLVRRPVAAEVAQLVVPDVRRALGPLAAAIHGHPARYLRTVGITGTDGKTTTSFLLEGALRAHGWQTGLIGTVEVRVGNAGQTATFTTPEAPDLQRHLAAMVAAGTDAAVMEVSSHGIDQHRVDCLPFDVAVFTNLSAEHLDYHGTIEHYWATKARLFREATARLAVVCSDGEWGRRLAEQSPVPTVTFGAEAHAAVRITEVRSSLEGTRATLTEGRRSWTLWCALPGIYNAHNMAAAFLAARLLGVPAHEAIDGIARCRPVPGRFELVRRGQPFLVVVDYAHTPVALRGIMDTLHGMVPGRLIVVVGARGGRDRLKRPVTGRVAASADLAVLTADSPGPEDPARIVDELLAGTLDVPERNVVVELERDRAIALAVGEARAGDAVLIVGRGHERSRHVGERTVAFDDRESASEALSALGWLGDAGARDHASGGAAPDLLLSRSSGDLGVTGGSSTMPARARG